MKMKLSFHDRSNLVWSVIETSQDNNTIDHIGLVNDEIETELLRPIK